MPVLTLTRCDKRSNYLMMLIRRFAQIDLNEKTEDQTKQNEDQTDDVFVVACSFHHISH